MATSPPPNIQPYYAQVAEKVTTSPGTIQSAPPHQGLTNLPACFWITGQAVPAQTSVTMDLPGAPDAGGQQIIYHITLTVALDHVTWNFGDGSGSKTVPPLPCSAISGAPASLVAHNYVRISDYQPSGFYTVTATETYVGSVVMTWTDDNGPQRQNVDLGSAATQNVTTAPFPIQVEQEEAVGTGDH